MNVIKKGIVFLYVLNFFFSILSLMVFDILFNFIFGGEILFFGFGKLIKFIYLDMRMNYFNGFIF